MAERALAARARIALTDRSWGDGLAPYQRRDYPAALTLLATPHGRSRRTQSQYELARLHDEGLGTPKDAAKALDLYRLAAEAGHVHALALAISITSAKWCRKITPPPCRSTAWQPSAAARKR